MHTILSARTGFAPARLGASLRRWQPLLLALLLLLPALSTRAQRTRGSDGNRTVASGSVIVNEYTPLTADALSGSTAITVASNNLNANGRFPVALTQGDLLLIIQMQGATISAVDNPAFGEVTNYNFAGRYELLEVASVAGSTTINLTCGLKNTYSVDRRVQVVRLPRFNTLTVNAGATLTASPWNTAAATGGIAAMEVANGTILNGTINVTGLGFQGGVADNTSDGGGVVITTYRGATPSVGGEKGESIAGSAADYYESLGIRYGRGAIANGGGGGNSHNAGGGGGANAGTGPWTGAGNPDRGSANAYDAAWNLEGAGFATTTSAGGGRGGYSYASTDQNALTVAPGNGTWGGNSRSNIGGLGGRPLDTRGRLYLGGGGGAGDGNNGGSTSGGNGGGIAFLLTGGAISGSGSVVANGATGLRYNSTTVFTSSGQDAAGGGGGGGTIVLQAAGTITGITASAQGGTGGSQAATGTESEGPGGGGGGGLVLFTNNAGTSLTTQVQGGANGTTTSPSMTEFPPNGGTRGGAGVVRTLLYNAQCAVADVTTTLVPTANPTNAGQPGGFTVTFRNVGPDGANELIGQVQLPAGLTGVSVSNGGSYDPATGLVTYPTLLNLTSGQVFTSTISFTTPAVASVSATSSISTTTGQGANTNPDTASSTFNVTPVADVTTTITGPAVLGRNQPSGLYTVNFTNNGPSTGDNVTQTVTLPAGVSAASVSAPGSQSIVTNGDGTVTITYPPAATLASGATNSFQFSFTAPNANGAVALVSNVGTSTSQGPNTAADQFTFNANVTNVTSDLQVTISASAATAPLQAGQAGSFSVVFRNNGPQTANAIVAQVQLPVGLNVTNAGGGTYDPATGIVTFSGLTTLANNGTSSPVIQFTAPADGGTVAATATISSSSFDSNSANNSASTSIVADPNGDVVTTISGPATAAAGSTVTYVATVQNNGPSTATNVVPTVQLPRALLSLTLPAGAAYDVNTGIVTLPATSSLAANAPALSYSIAFTLPANNQPVSGQSRATAATNDVAVANNNGSLSPANVATTVTLPAGSCPGSGFDGQAAVQGLYAEYFKGYFNDNFSFFNTAPNLARTISTVNYPNSNGWGDITPAINAGNAANPDQFSSRMRGYITITTGGTYTFSLYSDDAAWLWVGNNARDANLLTYRAVVDGRGLHGPTTFTGTLNLAAGTYPVQLLYGENGGGNVLTFSYNGPDTGGSTVIVPASVLCSTQFGGPLPVELTEFTAASQDLDAQLAWTTAQEKNSAYFDVERSADGRQFSAIGRVKAAGSASQPRHYALRDAGAGRVGRTLHYRLRQVDQDGTTTFSPVRTVQFAAGAAQLSVVPNPATDRLHVSYPDAAAAATATVYSLLGQPLLRQVLDASGKADFDLRALPAGSYVLRLYTTQGLSRSTHFVKQ